MTQSKALSFDRICWLGILLPLSIDNMLSLPLGKFNIRINYLFAALYCAVRGTQALRAYLSKKKLTLSAAPLTRQMQVAILGFALCGALGIFWSENPKRSVAYWVWTVGTLATLPWLIRSLHQRIGLAVLKSLLLYFLAQSVLITWDFVVHSLGAGSLAIGRVFMATAARPHAFYQEPNYYAGFAILMLTGIRLKLPELKAARDRAWLQGAFLLGLLSLALCTSKMGYAWVAAYGAWEALSWVARRWSRRVSTAALLAATVAIGGALWQAAPQLGEKLKRDESTQERIESARAATRIAVEHPLFGVGPGAAGAYYSRHGLDAWEGFPYLHGKSKEEWRSLPLSNNLWTEIMSEWGFVGFFFFVSFLVALAVRPFEGSDRWLVTLSILVVYAASQTLARFDLWVLLSLLGVIQVRAGGKGLT